MSVKKSKTEHCKEESGYIWECDLRQNIHMVAAAELLSRAYVCHQGTKYISLYKYISQMTIHCNSLSQTFSRTRLPPRYPKRDANYFICFTNIHMKRGAILCRPIHCTGLAFKRFVAFTRLCKQNFLTLDQIARLLPKPVFCRVGDQSRDFSSTHGG